MKQFILNYSLTQSQTLTVVWNDVIVLLSVLLQRGSLSWITYLNKEDKDDSTFNIPIYVILQLALYVLYVSSDHDSVTSLSITIMR